MACRVRRFSVLGDGTKELPHRPCEPVGEPLAVEVIARGNAIAFQLDEIRSVPQLTAANGPLCTMQPERMSITVRVRTPDTPDQGVFSVFVLELTPHSPGSLTVRRLIAGTILTRSDPEKRRLLQPATNAIDPMEPIVVNGPMGNGIKRCARYPVEAYIKQMRDR